MARSYRRLFSFGILHEYYTKGDGNRDFIFAPSPVCNQLLSDGSLLLRDAPEGYMMFYRAREVDDGGPTFKPLRPMTDVPDGTLFTFYLFLKNPQFFNFTDLGSLDGVPIRGKVFYYNTDDGVTTIAGGETYAESVELPAPSLIPLYPPTFLYKFTVTGAPAEAEIRIKDSAGTQVVASFTQATDEDDAFTVPVDLSAWPEGRYSIHRYVAGVEDGTAEEVYVSGPAASAQPFAIVDIPKPSHWEDLQEFNETPGENTATSYTLSFSARTEGWKYLVVFARSTYSGDSNDYEITDDLLTLLDDRYNTTNVSDQFYFGLEEVTSVNGSTALRFRSEDSIGNPAGYYLYEEAKHDLILKKIGVKICNDLPNPAINTNTKEVFIYI